MTKVTKIYKNIKKSIDNKSNKWYYRNMENFEIEVRRGGGRDFPLPLGGVTGKTQDPGREARLEISGLFYFSFLRSKIKYSAQFVKTVTSVIVTGNFLEQL